MAKIVINDTKFLDRENDIKHKDVVSIVSEGKWEDSVKFKKEDGTPSRQFNVQIKLANEEVRGTTFSFANVKLLVSAFGDESKDWIGKEVRAWQTKSERAKNGYVFIFVPTDWTRNDMGDWEIPEHGYPNSFTSADQERTIEYPENDLGDPVI